MIEQHDNKPIIVWFRNKPVSHHPVVQWVVTQFKQWLKLSIASVSMALVMSMK